MVKLLAMAIRRPIRKAAHLSLQAYRRGRETITRRPARGRLARDSEATRIDERFSALAKYIRAGNLYECRGRGACRMVPARLARAVLAVRSKTLTHVSDHRPSRFHRRSDLIGTYAEDPKLRPVRRRPVHARTVRLAAEIVGGPEALAAQLDVRDENLKKWLEGQLAVPQEIACGASILLMPVSWIRSGVGS
jgi:hypothetical protein